MKKRIMNMIRKWVGFSEEKQNLINYVESFESDIAIYRAGKFPIQIPFTQEPLVFLTEPERNTFVQGYKLGVETMGGNSAEISQKFQQEFEEMDTKATHLPMVGRMN